MPTGDPPCPHCGQYTFVSDANPTGQCPCKGLHPAPETFAGRPPLPLHPFSIPILPRLVIIESPFAGDIEANLLYARRAIRDSLRRGEAPFASHLLYTQPGVLDDGIEEEREQGIKAGFAWRQVATLTAVYQDRGITPGMQQGIQDAINRSCPVEYRNIGS